MSEDIVIRSGEIEQLKQTVTGLNGNIVVIAKSIDAQNEVIGNNTEMLSTISEVIDLISKNLERFAARLNGFENRLALLEEKTSTSKEGEIPVIDM